MLLSPPWINQKVLTFLINQKTIEEHRTDPIQYRAKIALQNSSKMHNYFDIVVPVQDWKTSEIS